MSIAQDALSMTAEQFSAYRKQRIAEMQRTNNRADVAQFIKAADSRFALSDVVQYVKCDVLKVREGQTHVTYAYSPTSKQWYSVRTEAVA